MIRSKCEAPWTCMEEVLQKPELTVSCPGDVQNNETAFGIDPTEFQQTIGYADFLFSLTDNPFLFRGGEVRSTSEFIDSATESAKIMLVFFTPKAGITSVLTVNTNFMQESSASTTLELIHYEMLELQNLADYVTVQTLVLVFDVFIIIDSFVEMLKMFRSYKILGEPIDPASVFKIFVDLAACGMTLAFVAMRIPTKNASV